MSPSNPFFVILAIITVFAGVIPLLVAAVQVLIASTFSLRYLSNSKMRTAAPVNVAIVIPAWNEAPVLRKTVQQMASLRYPKNQLRIYLIDDASTDETGEVMPGLVDEFAPQLVWLRREKGGEGKAHTLNYGLSRILEEGWAEAILITDADVLYTEDSLLQMVRHFADPQIGAVTAYVKEGSEPGTYLNKFIAYEYATAQAVSRRAMNIVGTQACLAGGAQLLRVDVLRQIGGRIDTTTLAEDTVTTFNVQEAGYRVYFEPSAVVWAEEPHTLKGLWGQRLRWGRGNVQVTLKFKNVWLRWWKHPHLGSPFFALTWFAILLQPVLMILATVSLVYIRLLEDSYAFTIFRWLWILSGVIYLLVIAGVWAVDPATFRRTWKEAVLFPGVISTMLIWIAMFPGPAAAAGDMVLDATGMSDQTREQWAFAGSMFMYVWLSVAILVSYLAKTSERIPYVGGFVSRVLLWIGGYGAFLCSITIASIVMHVRKGSTHWVKTEKSGQVMVGGGEK